MHVNAWEKKKDGSSEKREEKKDAGKSRRNTIISIAKKEKKATDNQKTKKKVQRSATDVLIDRTVSRKKGPTAEKKKNDLHSWGTEDGEEGTSLDDRKSEVVKIAGKRGKLRYL